MRQKLKLAQGLFAIATPLVTGFLFTASPTLAITLASSQARVNLDNFSHEPIDIFTLTDTETTAIATKGKVTADANAKANFIVDPFGVTKANNFSLSEAAGDGKNYLGLAKSFAAIIGYDFFVGEGETFSFDFQAFLELKTSIDNPLVERARANGIISLELYDYTNANSRFLIDSFTISGALATLGNKDFLDYQKSASLTFNPNETTFEKSFGGQQEFAKATVDGSYSRTFDSLTRLMLVEVKANQVNVKATVPESSSWLALLSFSLLSLGYGVKSKSRSKHRK